MFRGTQNGETTTHLIHRFGLEALSGETSVFGQLAEEGLPVIRAKRSTDREHVDYDGGYTVITYGSSEKICNIGSEVQSADQTWIVGHAF